MARLIVKSPYTKCGGGQSAGGYIVNECYQKWWELQCRVSDFYSERERQRPPLSQQKEFRAIKNAVIQEAEHIWQNQITYDDERMEDQGGWLSRNGISQVCLDLWDKVK